MCFQNIFICHSFHYNSKWSDSLTGSIQLFFSVFFFLICASFKLCAELLDKSWPSDFDAIIVDLLSMHVNGVEGAIGG